MTGGPDGRLGSFSAPTMSVLNAESGAKGIVEPRVAETRFVDDIGRKDARVRTEVLLIVGDDLAATDVDGLRGLIFVSPAITAGPLRFRRFDEIHSQDEPVTVQRRGAVLDVVVGQDPEAWRNCSTSKVSVRSG